MYGQYIHKFLLATYLRPNSKRGMELKRYIFSSKADFSGQKVDFTTRKVAFSDEKIPFQSP
jgi:hypothetical protein